MKAIGLRGCSGCMREISLFVTFLFVSFFFSFLHVACRSPRLTDFDDPYVKMRGPAQGSVFWGLDDNTKCLVREIPQKPNFGAGIGILSQIFEN